MDGSIKELFQKMIPQDATLMQGTVTSESPLLIQAAGDSLLILSESILLVPFHLKDYKTKMESDTFGICEVTVKNALKLGDKVYLLSLNQGKKYYILDRVESEV